MDSSGTWTLAKEISGPFRGLPCCWNEAGWKRGLPDPAVQLLGKGIGGPPGAAARGMEVLAGSAAPAWNTDAAILAGVEGLEVRRGQIQVKTFPVQQDNVNIF